MTIGEAIRAATEQLATTSDTARLDAEVLMAHALGVSRSDLLLRHMRDAAPEGFAALVARRAAHEPVAHITGVQEFYGLPFAVTPHTLIPRGDSETLVEAARSAFTDRPAPKRILDLGTGSGALLLTVLTIWPKAEGLGLDCSAEALFVAIRNAQRLASTSIAFVGSGPETVPPQNPDAGFARFIQRDWTKRGWRRGIGVFDLIISNPPYIEEAADLDRSVRDFEPASALFAGPEGLDDYRVLIPQLRALMAPDGAAIFEIGHRQADAVTAIAHDNGFAVALRHDLAGRPRALVLT